jgi:tyrosyl-tRNA synthetase
MWRYYTLLTDLTPDEIGSERERATPMASKKALARRIVADFHGEAAAAVSETEWTRVHQQRQMPADMPQRTVAAGTYKPHEFLAEHELARSNSDAVRLLRQGAVKKDGAVLDPRQDLRLAAGDSFVLSVGPRVYMRFEVGAPSGA